MSADHREKQSAKKTASQDSTPESNPGRDKRNPQHDPPTVRILYHPAGSLQLDFSKNSPEYSRRIAQKLVRAKIVSGQWNHYHCRDGTVVQLVSTHGTPLEQPQPLRSFQVNVWTEQKTVRGILIRNMTGPEGNKIALPITNTGETETNNQSGPSHQKVSGPERTVSINEMTSNISPLAATPLADWSRLKTKPGSKRQGKPAAAKQLPDKTTTNAPELPLPNRASGELPNWAFDRTKSQDSTFAASTWGLNQGSAAKEEWEWLKPSRATEKQLLELLQERNGELHLKRRQTNENRQRNPGPPREGPTWIDSFFKIANHKFGSLETPLCRLAEVYLRPDYLTAPHADKRSVTKTVDCVVGLLMTAKKSRKQALKQFAAELLERGKYPDVENISVAATTRKGLSQLTRKLVDPKTSIGDGLQIIMQDLGDSMHFEYEQMRKSASENEKIEIIATCRDALSHASKSKAFRNCNSEQREQLKGIINGWGDRLTSYVNTNQLPQPENR